MLESNFLKNGLMEVHLLSSGFLGSSSLRLSLQELFKTMLESMSLLLMNWILNLRCMMKLHHMKLLKNLKMVSLFMVINFHSLKLIGM